MASSDHKFKSTTEIYRDVVQVEVRALVQRVGELTTTVGALFEEVSAAALSLELTMENVQHLDGSIDQCKNDIQKLKSISSQYDETVGGLMAKVAQLETMINKVSQDS